MLSISLVSVDFGSVFVAEEFKSEFSIIFKDSDIPVFAIVVARVVLDDPDVPGGLAVLGFLRFLGGRGRPSVTEAKTGISESLKIIENSDLNSSATNTEPKSTETNEIDNMLVAEGTKEVTEMSVQPKKNQFVRLKANTMAGDSSTISGSLLSTKTVPLNSSPGKEDITNKTNDRDSNDKTSIFLNEKELSVHYDKTSILSDDKETSKSDEKIITTSGERIKEKLITPSDEDIDSLSYDKSSTVLEGEKYNTDDDSMDKDIKPAVEEKEKRSDSLRPKTKPSLPSPRSKSSSLNSKLERPTLNAGQSLNNEPITELETNPEMTKIDEMIDEAAVEDTAPRLHAPGQKSSEPRTNNRLTLIEETVEQLNDEEDVTEKLDGVENIVDEKNI
jgi:hypothetical protein